MTSGEPAFSASGAFSAETRPSIGIREGLAGILFKMKIGIGGEDIPRHMKGNSRGIGVLLTVACRLIYDAAI